MPDGPTVALLGSKLTTLLLSYPWCAWEEELSISGGQELCLYLVCFIPSGLHLSQVLTEQLRVKGLAQGQDDGAGI